MKFLCLCNHGNVRSVALRTLIWRTNGDKLTGTTPELIKNFVKNEAIAMGAHSTTRETLEMLINWADKVIDLSDNDEQINPLLEELSGDKYIRYDIGPDIWGYSLHPDLQNKLKPLMKLLFP